MSPTHFTWCWDLCSRVFLEAVSRSFKNKPLSAIKHLLARLLHLPRWGMVWESPQYALQKTDQELIWYFSSMDSHIPMPRKVSITAYLPVLQPMFKKIFPFAIRYIKSSWVLVTQPNTNGPCHELAAVELCTEAQWQVQVLFRSQASLNSINKENKKFLIVAWITSWEGTKRRGGYGELKCNCSHRKLTNLGLKVMNTWPERFADFN